jgi:hypothetical protein
METQQEPTQTKKSRRDWATLSLGILALLIACIFMAGSIALDLIGEKTTGKLSNVAECSGNKSCWTSQVDFTTSTGEEVAFYPMTFPMLLDFDPFLSGRPYEEYSEYQVRYFAGYPQLAKIKLAYFLEYINHICGLCVGAFLLLISAAFSSSRKANKPFVIDLSRK